MENDGRIAGAAAALMTGAGLPLAGRVRSLDRPLEPLSGVLVECCDYDLACVILAHRPAMRCASSDDPRRPAGPALSSALLLLSA